MLATAIGAGITLVYFALVLLLSLLFVPSLFSTTSGMGQRIFRLFDRRIIEARTDAQSLLIRSALKSD